MMSRLQSILLRMMATSSTDRIAILSLIVIGLGQIGADQVTAGSIEITNATIVDVASGARQTGLTVVIRSDRIAQTGRGIAIPRGAVRVDGTGKFLMPGLWD